MKTENMTRNMITWPEQPETEAEVTRRLMESPLLYGSYQRLNPEWRQRFVDFCQGKRSLPLTYDPFFKWIFHPDIHPGRLSRLISSLLGTKMRIVGILPNEDSLLAGDSLLIMDLLGETEDGSLVYVEIQKQGYAFPAERISCYLSDLVMRQYSRVKGEKGRAFTYRDIKKVYVIVIYEQSAKVFHEIPDACIHYGRNLFNTGLKMELLCECCLVALDVFRKFPYAKDRSEQTAWLSLLTTEDLAEAEGLIAEYPWLEEIYGEIAMLRQRPEEVLGMFSEALKILDQNTVKYMIEELQKKVEERDAAIDKIVGEKEALLSEKEAAIHTLTAEKEALINRKDAEIRELKKRLEELSERVSEEELRENG